jgi:hypothetical protein
MLPAEWRSLIEAYLDGRLSAEAFARRFMDAWRAQRDARTAPIPAAIESLFFAVEAFEGASQDADVGATSDDDVRQAAQRALRDLRGEPAVQPHTFDRTRAREEMRRFEIRVNRLAGLGCLIAFAWVALCVLQIYFVSEWIQLALGWGAWPSAVVGFVLAFVPIVGNVLAFLGATQEGWAPWLAAIVFFAAPAATFLSGWTRWRRTRR